MRESRPPPSADRGASSFRLVFAIVHHSFDAVEFPPQLPLAQGDRDHINDHHQPGGQKTVKHERVVLVHDNLLKKRARSAASYRSRAAWLPDASGSTPAPWPAS